MRAKKTPASGDRRTARTRTEAAPSRTSEPPLMPTPLETERGTIDSPDGAGSLTLTADEERLLLEIVRDLARRGLGFHAQERSLKAVGALWAADCLPVQFLETAAHAQAYVRKYVNARWYSEPPVPFALRAGSLVLITRGLLFGLLHNEDGRHPDGVFTLASPSVLEAIKGCLREPDGPEYVSASICPHPKRTRGPKRTFESVRKDVDAERVQRNYRDALRKLTWFDETITTWEQNTGRQVPGPPEELARALHVPDDKMFWFPLIKQVARYRQEIARGVPPLSLEARAKLLCLAWQRLLTKNARTVTKADLKEAERLWESTRKRVERRT